MRSVLCLHGRRQCGLTFAKKLFPSITPIISPQTGHVAIIHEEFEFVFPNAPFASKPDLPKGFKPKLNLKCPNPSLFSWWGEDKAGDDGTAAINAIQEVIQGRKTSSGAFEGIIGFSQGGALAASLCRENSAVFSPQFAIFISAYHTGLPSKLSCDSSSSSNATFRSSIRSLHAFSNQDQVVPAAKSQALMDWTNGKAQRLELTGGHAVPAIGTTSLVPWIRM